MAQEDISRLRIEKTAPGEYHKRRRSYIIWAVIVAAIIVVALILSRALSRPEVKPATVSLTYPSQAITVLNASGYIVAERKAALASKTTGRLVWLGVEEGNRVEKGQIVARLENEDVSAALDQARASVKAARENLAAAEAELSDAATDFGRKKELSANGVIPKSVFDAADARLKKARAARDAASAQVAAGTAVLKGAEASLGYTYIRAPFSGVVLTKNADIGDIITPLGAAANAKAAVVTIADLGTLQVEADVSESNISLISKGMPCEIALDALPNERFRGVVHMIVPTADRTKASVLVKVRFLEKDPRILPEMSAKAAFLSRQLRPDEEAPRVTVPASSIISEEGGRKAVFAIEGETIKKVQVTTGMALGDSIEVPSGLKPGQRIVLAPLKGLEDGKKVKVTEG